MKPAHDLLHWRLLLAVVLVLGSATIGGARVMAQTGTATSSASPSNAAPSIGQQVVVTINIDMSSVNSPDNKLGSFTGTLDWNPAVLAYGSNSGILASFTGLVNTTGVATGHITFNGANAMGAAGNIIVLTITFDVVGAGTSALSLEYSVMAATGTFASLLPILTIMDGQVVVGSAQPTLTPTVTPAASHTATATEAPTRTNTPAASRTPTATGVPTLTGTPVAPTPTLTPSPTPEATATPTPTGVPSATPTITPAPTARYWTYLSLLITKATQSQGYLPLARVLDWKCISDPSECCGQQSRVVPRLFPRLAPFCPR